MAVRNFSNTAAGATLTGNLAAGATSVPVSTTAGFPAAPFAATIARNLPTEESVLVTAVVGTTLTVTRGYDGTSAQAQVAGATFEHTALAVDFNEANAHVNAVGAVHGVAGSLVGTTDAQTLTNKTIQTLVALATNSAVGVQIDVPSGSTQKQLTGRLNSVEQWFVDYQGSATFRNLTAVNGTLTGTLAVTGATTLTGALTASGGVAASTVSASGTIAANNGITIPTTKTLSGAGGINITGDAAAANITGSGLVKGAGLESTAAAVLAQVADPAGTASKLTAYAKSDGGLYVRPGTGVIRRASVDFGSVTAYPTDTPITGDTCTMSNLQGMQLRYDGTKWTQDSGPTLMTQAQGNTLHTTGALAALIPRGALVHYSDTSRICRWDSTAQGFVRIAGPTETVFENGNLGGSGAFGLGAEVNLLAGNFNAPFSSDTAMFTLMAGWNTGANNIMETRIGITTGGVFQDDYTQVISYTNAQYGDQMSFTFPFRLIGGPSAFYLWARVTGGANAQLITSSARITA